MEKKYSAGLVSRRFWQTEFKQYVQLRKLGLSDTDIKQKNEDENIFLAVSNSRKKEIFLGVKRRVSFLDEEVINLFENLDIDNQRLLNFATILITDELIKDFMIEVYYFKQKNQDFKLTKIDYRTFFTEKQRESDEMKRWKEYTLKRLAGVYHTYLSEAGLIQSETEHDLITPKFMDSRLNNWLISNGYPEISRVLGGDFDN
ncbi:MAG: DUF1819 family protein [Streptococcaceae bacterium]|jgi:hypothetical protein|nr:DUF1819 family protein [Streptococcaceae bacterium]